MKNKKIPVLLIVVAVFQLVFPLSFMAYEKIAMNAVVEKGTSYTLEYTKFDRFDKEVINLNTDDMYTVGYVFDIEKLKEDEDFIPHNTISVYKKVVIKEREDGTFEFFDAESCDKSVIKKDNCFNVDAVFHMELDEYEFVNDNVGLRQIAELANFVSDNYDEHFDVDEFLAEDSYYGGFYWVPIEGKVTIKVYNGFAKITELYLGDELILKLK